MKKPLFIILATLAFALLVVGLSTAAVLWGLLLAGLLVLFHGIIPDFHKPARTLWNLTRFLVDFAVDLVKSNLVLAWDVLTPHDYHTVRLVLVPVEDLSAREIALLSNRITLTPGTVTCGMDGERKVLLVHAMFASDDAATALRRPIDILKGNA